MFLKIIFDHFISLLNFKDIFFFYQQIVNILPDFLTNFRVVFRLTMYTRRAAKPRRQISDWPVIVGGSGIKTLRVFMERRGGQRNQKRVSVFGFWSLGQAPNSTSGRLSVVAGPPFLIF
jgi:hypothetical protein